MSQKDCNRRWLKRAGGVKHTMKHNAVKRGIPFDLVAEDIREMLDYAICYYCGQELNMENKRALNGFTIDRLDNNEGYIVGNIVPCCRRCNLIKGSWFTAEQMLEIAETYLTK